MEIAYIKTPIGIAELKGDVNGLVSITVSNKEKTSDLVIPEILKEAVSQFKAVSYTHLTLPTTPYV